MDDLKYPHVGFHGMTFIDRKGRLSSYFICYLGVGQAKGMMKELIAEGFPVKSLVKYDRIESVEPTMIKPKPAYLIFLTSARVLIEIHRKWFINPEVVWRKK